MVLLNAQGKAALLCLSFLFSIYAQAETFDFHNHQLQYHHHDVYSQTSGGLRIEVTAHSQHHDVLPPLHIDHDDPNEIYVKQNSHGLGVLYQYDYYCGLNVYDDPQIDSFFGYTDHLEFRFYDAVTGLPTRARISKITFSKFKPVLDVDDAIISTLDGDLLLNVTDDLIGQGLSYKALAGWGEDIHTAGTWSLSSAFIVEGLTIAAGTTSDFQIYAIEAEHYNNSPIIVSEPVTVAQETLPYAYQVQAIDEDNDQLTYSLVNPPEGMVIDGTDALIQWVPAEGQAGSYTVTVRVTDAYGGSFDHVYDIDVLEKPNEPPVITSEPVLEGTATLEYSYQVIAQDPDGDSITFGLLNGPTGMTIDAQTGLLQWLPEEGAEGNYTIVVGAEDGNEGTAIQEYSLTVQPKPNDAPEFTSTPISVGYEGSTYHYAIQATDPDGDALSFSLADSPANMNIITSTGVISWEVGYDDAGSYPVVIVIDDGEGLTAQQSFVLVIENTNRAPVAQPQNVSTNEDETIAITLQASDADDDALEYQITSAPTNGVINGEGNQLTYSPNADFNGADQFGFVANDGASVSAEVIVSITVNSVNDAPLWQYSPNITAAENIPYSTTVQAIDPDGDSLNYQITSAPDGMEISETTGLINWIPNFDQAGGHNVTVTVSDAAGVTIIDSFVINVSNTNRSPIITSQLTATAQALSEFQYQLTANDPDGDPISFAFVDGAPDAIFNTESGLLVWTPAEEDTGTLEFEFTITDDQNAQTVVILTVNVEALPNQLPEVLSSAHLTAIVEQPYQYHINAIDHDGELLNFNSINLPEFLTLSPQGEILGTPAIADLGIHTIVVGISDEANTVEYSFDLNVIELPETKPAYFGRDFWFVDPMDFNGYDDLALTIFITSIDGATVSIESPRNPERDAINVNVAANSVETIEYYYSGTSGNDEMQHDQISNRAVHISSDEDIAVYVLFWEKYSTDAEALIPTVSLDTEYRLMSYRGPGSKGAFGGTPSYSFVATEDATTLTLKPNKEVQLASGEIIASNDSYSVSLDRGQVYTLVANSHIHFDISGSEASADKPIATFITDSCAEIPWSSSGPCDRLNEQLPPIKNWGHKHILVPFYSRYIDMVRVLADQDDTQITINGVIAKVLNAGEFWQYEFSSAQLLHSNKPILVEQFSTSASHDSEQRAQDSGYNLTRTDLVDKIFEDSIASFGQEYTVSIDPTTKTSSVMLFVPETSRNAVLVNGELVNW